MEEEESELAVRALYTLLYLQYLAVPDSGTEFLCMHCWLIWGLGGKQSLVKKCMYTILERSFDTCCYHTPSTCPCRRACL